MNLNSTNEPVAVNSLVIILGAIFTPILAKYGIDNGGSQALFAGIGSLATALLSIWGVARARSQVTPVVAPKDNTGTPLTPGPPGTTVIPPAAPAAPAAG